MKIWDKNIFDSKIKSEDVSKAEIFLGYLIGPSLMYLMITALSGTYLMQFYTDVIGISGSLIIIMPIVSKILVAVMNIFFSDLIRKTNTSQGKARPWVLVSGIVMPLAGILLYMVPKASYQLQVLWILFSYNVFFVIAFNLYSLSHSMLLPRSTRVSKQRDKLSLFKNISESMIPGTLSVVIMPFIIRAIGVGNEAQNGWFRFMLLLSIIAIPAAVIEYCFTKERISDQGESLSIFKQLKESFRYKDWLMVVALLALQQLNASFPNSAMIYFSNWVLGNSVDSGANYQFLLNVIGQAPIGIGTMLMWPIVRKYGKFQTMRVGYLFGIIGNLIVLFCEKNIPLLLAGMMIRSLGTIPMMLSISLLSDAIDRVEERSGHRFDSLGASLNSIIHNITLGLAQTSILLSIESFGYIVPNSASQVIEQPQMLKIFFRLSMAGIPLICFIGSFFLINRIIKNMGQEA